MKSLIFLLFFAFFNILNSQVSMQWSSRYNGPGNGVDESFAVTVDGSGNVYITGSSTGSGSNLDFATIKYNSSGQQQWAARYNGPGNFIDRANAITIDGSGNVYVTGMSTGTTSFDDYATIKYNSSGQEQWVARYNGPVNGSDEAFSIAVDISGNVYVTGQSLSTSNYDFATIKYNSSGQQQWVARYNGPGNSVDNGLIVRVDAAGNVYAGGGSTGSGSGFDYATVKYNSSGQELWAARYNGPNNANDVPNDLAVDGSGNVYISGGSSGTTSFNDYATVKYNSSGQQQWASRYNGPGNDADVAFSMVVNAIGNVYVTGASTGSGSATDYATIMYNSSGVQQWVARYNGPNNTTDEATSITIDGSGNAYVTGQSNAGGTNYDFLTLKYDMGGTQMWEQRYNGPGNGVDAAMSIAVDAGSNVYVTGPSAGSGTASDFATIKYSQPTGITPISNQIPDEFKLYNNYPNPFNPSTKIRFDLPAQSQTNITVYDLMGREVKTLVNEVLGAGAYEFVFDAEGLASDIYIYRMQTNSFVDSKKMVLVK